MVLNKFCYIDQDADVGHDTRSMAGLEAAHPDTVFVYMTIPLKTKDGYLKSLLKTQGNDENFQRNVFNDKLREWARAHNKVLLDVADIEAHDVDGAAESFEYNGRMCQALCKSYTEDGRHLDDAPGLGRQRVAKGFYALAAALLNAQGAAGAPSDRKNP